MAASLRCPLIRKATKGKRDPSCPALVPFTAIIWTGQTAKSSYSWAPRTGWRRKVPQHCKSAPCSRPPMLKCHSDKFVLLHWGRANCGKCLTCLFLPEKSELEICLPWCRVGPSNNSKGLYSIFPSGLPPPEILKASGPFLLKFSTTNCPETSKRTHITLQKGLELP